MKICKQCGRSLPDESFRAYKPRGKGIRHTKQGRNTICITCENLNANMAVLWKKQNKTEEEDAVLARAAEYYKKLVDTGLQPIGTYAKHVLGTAAPRRRASEQLLDVLDSSMQHLMDSEDKLLAEYNKLLQLTLTEEPDVYQNKLEKLMEQSMGPDNKVQPRYVDIFRKVAEKFDEYEDSYTW